MDTQYIFFGADIHADMNRFQSVMKVLEDAKYRPSVVVLDGDYVGQGKPPRFGPNPLWQPSFSLFDIYDVIHEALPKTDEILCTYGSHDKNEIHGNSLFFSGLREYNTFDLYGLSFIQTAFSTRQQASTAGYDGLDQNMPCAKEAATLFRQTISKQPKGKPVFVISHMPLHAARGDNFGADDWVDALNETALERPVFFLYGHNHSYEKRNPQQDFPRFVEAGSDICIQGTEPDTVLQRTIHFTYLKIGYILNGQAVLTAVNTETVKFYLVDITAENTISKIAAVCLS